MINLEKFGQYAYTEYASSGGWLTADGRSMPSWVAMHPNEKNRWTNVAIAIADEIKKAATPTEDEQAVLAQLAKSLSNSVGQDVTVNSSQSYI